MACLCSLCRQESEIQLPPPPPLEGQPWVVEEQEAVERDPHGWAAREAEEGQIEVVVEVVEEEEEEEEDV